MPAALRGISSASSASTTFSVSKPSGAAEGDVLIAFQTVAFGSASSMTTPSGGATWTLLTSVNGSDGIASIRVWWKVAGASEPTSYTFRQSSGNTGGFTVIAAVHSADTGTPLRAVGARSGESSVDTPGVTPTSTGAFEMRFVSGVGIDDVSWTPPTGYTERVDTLSGLVGASLVTRTLTAAASSGDKTHTASSFLLGGEGVTVAVLAGASSGGGGGGVVPPPTIPALPSTERVVHYTYEFCDLLTDDLIAKDLDLFDVSYDIKIIEPGMFSASLVITDEATAAKVARIVPRHPEDLSTGPGRTIVHVYRNGVVWGSYVIWQASVSRAGRGQHIQVRLDGLSLESYLNQVKIREDLSFEETDQVDIARGLLEAMQSEPRYDIGLALTAGTSGVTRDREYLASEASTYGERLAELAQVDDGFEWIIQVVDNEDGTRTRHWTWGYPTLGQTQVTHVFTEPGNVLSWQEDIDALRGGTTFQTRGESIDDDASTTSEALTSAVAVAQDHINAGWPGIDKTIDYSSVSDEDTLNDYAAWWASNRAGAVRVHQVTVRLPANTSFGPGNIGDRVMLMLVNPWWPIQNGVASFAKTWRVVGMAFKPPAKGSGIEECTLTFEESVEA